MSALTTVTLNTEFGLLWSMRQLLRGTAIGIGVASALVTLTLFALAEALGNSLDTLQERFRLTGLSFNTTQQTTPTRGLKEVSHER